MARHPKYKTEKCRSYHTTGVCPYGPRCHFIHDQVYEEMPAEDRVALAAEGDASSGTSGSTSQGSGGTARGGKSKSHAKDPNIPREALNTGKVTIPLEVFPLMQQIVESGSSSPPAGSGEITYSSLDQMPVTVELNPELLAAASAQASVPVTASADTAGTAAVALASGGTSELQPQQQAQQQQQEGAERQLIAPLPVLGAFALGGEIHQPQTMQQQMRQPQPMQPMEGSADNYRAELMAMESQFQHIQVRPTGDSRDDAQSGGRTPPGFEQSHTMQMPPQQQQQQQQQHLMQQQHYGQHQTPQQHQPLSGGFGQMFGSQDWHAPDQLGMYQQKQPPQQQQPQHQPAIHQQHQPAMHQQGQHQQYQPMHQQIQQQPQQQQQQFYQPQQQLQQQPLNADWATPGFGFGGGGAGATARRDQSGMRMQGGNDHPSYPITTQPRLQQQHRAPPGMQPQQQPQQQQQQQPQQGSGARGVAFQGMPGPSESSESSSRLASWSHGHGVGVQ